MSAGRPVVGVRHGRELAAASASSSAAVAGPVQGSRAGWKLTAACACAAGGFAYVRKLLQLDAITTVLCCKSQLNSLITTTAKLLVTTLLKQPTSSHLSIQPQHQQT